jgi:alpha/beta superfamily hydrolase
MLSSQYVVGYSFGAAVGQGVIDDLPEVRDAFV